MTGFAQQVTFLYTHDLAATAHFYKAPLGLELVLDQGSCRIYAVAGSVYLGFCQRADAPLPATGVIVTRVASDVDGWYARLAAQSVAFKPASLRNRRGCCPTPATGACGSA